MKNSILKSKAFKLTSVLLAVLVLGVSIMAIVTNGFRNWGRSDLVPPVIDGGFVTDDKGNDLSDNEVHPMPKNMMFRASAADGQASDVTLTATIEPADATNQAVTWSAAFVNPSSTWATGKDVADYLTVTPASSGSLTATVSCAQPFGEKIRITVTSNDNPEAKATCTVDYAKRVTGFDVGIGAAGTHNDPVRVTNSPASFVNKITVYPDEADLVRSISFIPTFGVGTVEDTVTDPTTVRFTILDEFVQAAEAGFEGDFPDGSVDLPVAAGFFSGANFLSYFGFDDVPVEYQNGLYRLLNEFKDKGVVELSATLTGKYSGEVTETFILATSDMKIGVTGITLDESTLVI